MNKSKGFTIIELIVVIAIIAVLAGIVLVNVTQYISKGRDVAAEGNLATIMTNGAVWYDGSANVGISAKYSDGTLSFIGSTVASPLPAGTPANCLGSAGSGFIVPCMAIIGTTAGTGYALTYSCDTTTCQTNNAQKWCAMITLKATSNTFCVDSSGSKLNKASGTCVAGVCN